MGNNPTSYNTFLQKGEKYGRKEASAGRVNGESSGGKGWMVYVPFLLQKSLKQINHEGPICMGDTVSWEPQRHSLVLYHLYGISTPKVLAV